MNDSRLRALPLSLLLAGLFGLACAPCAAQEEAPGVTELAGLSLDALLDMPVTGASRLATRMTETAASVTVVTADEIRALGYRTLDEVLASIRGVTIASDHAYAYIGVRGFFAPGDYNTRVLLLIDGNRVNDNLFDQAYLGSEFPLDVAMIERVEFVPGQASAIYGANALFGVVNVVTKTPRADDTLQADLRLGSEGVRELRLGDAFTMPGGTLVQWSVTHAGMDAEDVAANGTITPYSDLEQRTSVYLKAKQGDFTATALHQQRVKGLALRLAGDPRTRNEDEQTLADLTWQHDVTATEQATARAFGGLYRFIGTFAYDVPPPVANENMAEGRWFGLEARLSTIRWAGHRTVMGADWQESPLQRQRAFDIEPPSAPYVDDRRRSRRVGLFAEDQWRLAPTWTLDASLRHDSIQDRPGETSSRLALLWQPDPRFVAKAIVGSAFRPPNVYESTNEVTDDGSLSTNPFLHSESVRGRELGIEWRPGPDDRMSASAYENVARDLIVLDPASYQYSNEGTLTARGIELEWEHAWSCGARLRANVSVQNAFERDTTVPLADYAAPYLANLVGILPLGAGLELGLQGQAVGRRGAAGAYTLANVTLSSALPAHGWSWSLSTFNVMDRRHDDPGADLDEQPTIAQDGRSLRAGVSYRF